MNTEKITPAAAVSDEDLEKVSGGYVRYHDNEQNKFYLWTGSKQAGDKYRCPNCGRLVHYGSWGRFYCDPCNESWFVEALLKPNLDASCWEEVSEEEYNAHGRRKPRIG